MAAAELLNVVYVHLKANIPDEKLTGDHLADLAIASVPSAGERNGIRYFADNVRLGIATPLTDEYRNAILRKTNARDLTDAEIAVKSRRT